MCQLELHWKTLIPITSHRIAWWSQSRRGRRDEKNEYNGRGSTWLECKVMMDFMSLIISQTRSLSGKRITRLASFDIFPIEIIEELCHLSWRQTNKKVVMSYLFWKLREHSLCIYRSPCLNPPIFRCGLCRCISAVFALCIAVIISSAHCAKCEANWWRICTEKNPVRVMRIDEFCPIPIMTRCQFWIRGRCTRGMNAVRPIICQQAE